MSHRIGYNGRNYNLVCSFSIEELKKCKKQLDTADNKYFKERNIVLNRALGVPIPSEKAVAYAELTPRMWATITAVVDMTDTEFELWKELNL